MLAGCRVATAAMALAAVLVGCGGDTGGGGGDAPAPSVLSAKAVAGRALFEIGRAHV